MMRRTWREDRSYAEMHGRSKVIYGLNGGAMQYFICCRNTPANFLEEALSRLGEVFAPSAFYEVISLALKRIRHARCRRTERDVASFY